MEAVDTREYPVPNPPKTILFIVYLNNLDDLKHIKLMNYMSNQISEANIIEVYSTEKKTYYMFGYCDYSSEIYETIKDLVIHKGIILNTITSRIPDEPDCLILKITVETLYQDMYLDNNLLCILSYANRNIQLFKYVLEVDKIDINLKSSISKETYKYIFKLLISRDKLDYLKLLIETAGDKIDINFRSCVLGYLSNTPLLYAAYGCSIYNPKIIEYLLKHPKIDISLKNEDNKTILHYTVGENDMENTLTILQNNIYQEMNSVQKGTIFYELLDCVEEKKMLDLLYSQLIEQPIHKKSIDLQLTEQQTNHEMTQKIIDELKDKTDSEIDEEILNSSNERNSLNKIIKFIIMYNLPLYIMLFSLFIQNVYLAYFK